MPGLPTRTVHGSSRAPAYAPARPHVRESLSDSERAAPSPIVSGLGCLDSESSVTPHAESLRLFSGTARMRGQGGRGRRMGAGLEKR